MELWKKVANLLLNGQAFLYASQLKMNFEAKGHVVDDKMFTDWQEEWLEEARKELGNDI